MDKKSIIISGAGLSGLTLGLALSQKGWEVNIFERSNELREVGAGLYTWENGLKVIEEIGVLDTIKSNIEYISSLTMVDKSYGPINSIPFNENNRFCVIPRQDIHRALVDACLNNGVKIATNAEAVSATDDGTIYLKDGKSYKADLVVAADGVHSKIREYVDEDSIKETVTNGAWRALIPRIPDDEFGIAQEHWNDYRRIGIAPSTDEYRYMYLTGRSDDEEALTEPFNKEAWISSFPHLESALNRIEDCRLDRYFYYIYMNNWSKGKVAILGDAAHGMEPNLGQGAGVSITSALELAKQLEDYEINEALEHWEKQMKPTVEYTQMWSKIYGASASHWPEGLLNIRPEVLDKVFGSKDVDEMMSLAARFVTGNTTLI